MKQHEEVIAAMERLGGIATLKQLNTEPKLKKNMNLWKTKTPFATIRRIVQKEPEITKIKPGLYCLTSQKPRFSTWFDNDSTSTPSADKTSHSYYQGLLAELGIMENLKTYIPAQDKNKLYLPKKKLEQVCSWTKLPDFSYPELIRRAKSIDTIWFSKRFGSCYMPDTAFEVEASTDMNNALVKFCDLQDFNMKMIIVADKLRKNEFNDKKSRPTFEPIRQRLHFWSFDDLAKKHEIESDN